MPDVMTITLNQLVSKWAPGSHPPPWTWEDEERDLHSYVCACCGQPGHYQRELEEHASQHGINQGVYLGPDGRVWDGHHRIVAAIRLGITTIPLEEGSAPNA